VSFAVICSVGAVANVGIAAFLYETRDGAGAVSALIGVLVGAVWNYALSSNSPGDDTRGRGSRTRKACPRACHNGSPPAKRRA